MTALIATGIIVIQDSLVDLGLSSDSATPSDSELQQRLDEILASKEDVGTRLESVRKRISNMAKEFDTYNKGVNDSLRDLSIQISKLQELIRQQTLANAAPPDDLDAEFESHKAEAGNDYYKEDYAEYANPAPSDYPEAKKLFRQIANKTHPDKTDNEDYHCLFLSAKEYLKDNNLQGLQDILNLLAGNASALLNRLLRQIEEERQELYNLKMQLDNAYGSLDYNLLQAYTADKDLVLRATGQQLEMRRRSLAAHLETLQRLTGTYVERPRAYSFTFVRC